MFEFVITSVSPTSCSWASKRQKADNIIFVYLMQGPLKVYEAGFLLLYHTCVKHKVFRLIRQPPDEAATVGEEKYETSFKLKV